MSFAYSTKPATTLPVGYQQYTGITATATSLANIPAGARWAIICCELQTVRWRDDSVAPTATVGMPLPPNGTNAFNGYVYAGTLANFQFISSSGTSATVNVVYYD